MSVPIHTNYLWSFVKIPAKITCEKHLISTHLGRWIHRFLWDTIMMASLIGEWWNREFDQLSNAVVDAARSIPMGSNQKQCCGSQFAKWHYIYTSDEYADEWRQDNADFERLSWMVSSCSASCSWRPLHKQIMITVFLNHLHKLL